MATPIRRCWDLTEVHLREATASRQAMGQLLKDMAEVARPDAGATKILLAVARLAKPSCDWVEGALRVEVEAANDGKKTRLAVMEDLGGGVRELVYPRLLIDAPFDEFSRSLSRGPLAVEPLQVQKSIAEDKIVLTHKKSRASQMPPSFELAEDCLRQTLTPAARKTIPPVARPALPKLRKVEPKPKAVEPKAVEPRAVEPRAVEPKLKAREPGPPTKREPPPARPEPPAAKRAKSERAPEDKRAEAPPPAKRRTTVPKQKPAPSPEGFMMDIPRAPKVLDFGDFLSAPPPRRQASEPPAKSPKKPSRIPPRR